jgi:hypothetical protein
MNSLNSKELRAINNLSIKIIASLDILEIIC